MLQHSVRRLVSRTYAVPVVQGALRQIVTDSHDDFKPKYNSEPVVDYFAQIKDDVTTNDIFIYMKGVPEEPKCGFSNMACRILDAYGVKYASRNVLADPNVREAIKKYTNWPTIPQVFIKGEFVGGSDILLDMHNKGELEKELEKLPKAG